MSDSDTPVACMGAEALRELEDEQINGPKMATLGDWLAEIGAEEAEMGLAYRVEIDSSRWLLVSKRCVADDGNDWCEVPTSLDDDGIATLWCSAKDDEPLVIMNGKIRDLLPLIGAATQVPFFFNGGDADEDPAGAR